MERKTAIISSTHVDKHGDRLALSALESGADQMCRSYLPVNIEHDPRFPPIGRIVSGRVVELSDGEFGLEAEIEMYKPGEVIPPFVPEVREMPLRAYPEKELLIIYDWNYRTEDDQEIITELSDILGSIPVEEIKKSLDPISILTIGGIFLLSQIAGGFLSQLGSDAYEIFKEKLKLLMTRRKEGETEKLLRFELQVQDGDHLVSIEIILTNPSETEIDSFLENGFQFLDNILPTYLDHKVGISKLVFSYDHGQLEFNYAIRKDAIPLTLEDKDT